MYITVTLTSLLLNQDSITGPFPDKEEEHNRDNERHAYQYHCEQTERYELVIQ